MKNYILKSSGAGNRFLLIDNKWFGKSPPIKWQSHSHPTNKKYLDFLNLADKTPSTRKSFIQDLLTQKQFSLAEGLVILKHSSYSLNCDFYNKDGSLAQMCGNAAVCIADYLASIGLNLPSFQLGTEHVNTLQNPKGEWGISLTSTPLPQGVYPFDWNGKTYSYTLICPGVPHGVIECLLDTLAMDFKNPSKLKTIAQSLRFKNPKNDQGMNVSFFQEEKLGYLQAFTYERGVEDFTLACGTGAVAAALVYSHKHKEKDLKTVFVQMPGGVLEVHTKAPMVLFSPVKKGF